MGVLLKRAIGIIMGCRGKSILGLSKTYHGIYSGDCDNVQGLLPLWEGPVTEAHVIKLGR